LEAVGLLVGPVKVYLHDDQGLATRDGSHEAGDRLEEPAVVDLRRKRRHIPERNVGQQT
jgi:hypothetical protein